MHALNDGIVTGDYPVLCGITSDSGRRDECNASACSFIVTPVPRPPV